MSTDEQAESGPSLDAQRATLTAEVECRGWKLVEVLVDEVSAKRGNYRQAFEQARTMLAAGEAGVLLATRLDRLSRSVADFADLMADAHDARWQIVALDRCSSNRRCLMYWRLLRALGLKSQRHRRDRGW